MIRTTLYAILLAFIIVFAVLACGLIIARTMIAILDYFDEEEEEIETYEEPSTTEEPPTTTTEPTVTPLPEITSQELDERVRLIENEIVRIWNYILKTR